MVLHPHLWNHLLSGLLCHAFLTIFPLEKVGRMEKLALFQRADATAIRAHAYGIDQW